MFWKKIELLNYLPFTHSNVKHVAIDFQEPCCAYLGNNGCGKSSLLRAMTPYSPVRTDYGPKGKIVKVLEHNGSIFELTSDFSNATAPHSFKKDGVECNLSGTTETQHDLIVEHLGVTKLIDDITAGNMKICAMSRAERRSLFSSTYPGDLSFVIDYHKKVCSQIRACSNQLKLLKSREASLRSSLIDDVEREKLIRFKEGATDLINRIDKCSLLLEEECKRYEQGPQWKDFLKHDYDGWEPLDVRDAILCLGMDIRRSFRKYGLRKKLKPEFNAFDIQYLASGHSLTAKNARAQIDIATHQMESVRDELNKFITCREANQTLSEKSNLEGRFKVCQEEYDRVSRDLGLGIVAVVPAEHVDTIESTIIPHLKTWTEVFHACPTKVKPKAEVVSIGVKLEHARIAINEEICDELANVLKELHSVKEKLDKLTSRPYPKDCTTVCPLRTAVSDNIASTEKRFNELVERKKNLNEQCAELQKFIEVNQPIFIEQQKRHQDIESVCKILQEFNLESVAFGGEDPIVCCNEHCYEILNRVVKACENTRLSIRKQELANEMEGIRKTLSTMANTKQLQLSANIIEETIKDREEKLNLGIQEIEKLEEKAKHEEELSSAIMKTADDFKELGERVDDAMRLLNQQRVDHILKFNHDLLADLSVAKQDLNAELYQVSKTLQDQQKHIDILESEIIPTAAKIEHDKANYEAVADGLSPTNGLPCIYLIRFINRLIARANAIIGKVWFYDLELMYLKEEEDLDFSIKVLIRKSTIVKDLNQLSMGQQAIVDLAMTLSICIERGFLDKYPLRLDEVDGALTDEHRTKLVCMLSDLIDKEVLKQLFLVNHFAMQTGMHRCDSVALNTEGIIVPENVNANAIVE